MSKKYLLDANVFIEAHRRYYAFDLVPSFWLFLTKCAQDNKIISIDRVKYELEKQEDILSNWIKDEFSEWFMSTDDENVIDNFKKLIKWTFEQEQFLDYAKSEFSNVADSWLIAYAIAYDYTIVTHEKYNPHQRNKILIPNVCKEFGVKYVDTFDMLRQLNFRQFISS